MKKFTAQDVLAVEPAATPEQVEQALSWLNQEPIPMAERWAEENDSIVRTMFSPPPQDRDGLTAAMRVVNAFAEARGFPIPFPPK